MTELLKEKIEKKKKYLLNLQREQKWIKERISKLKKEIKNLEQDINQTKFTF